MLFFICTCLPAVISVAIYEKLTKTDMPLKQWVYMYSVSAMVVNLFVWLVLRLQGKYQSINDFAMGGLIYYMAFAVSASVVFSFVAAWIKKNVKIWVENDEKKE